ncbi:hypothetical protein [Sulfuricella denitrificans]|uniref:hypothetical protein n=1 Tax=Sulfuricella denitrificans TaxID=649841 RepID=UPI0002881630|nr:hypothetical protein [Sulfuricella denitrificans]
MATLESRIVALERQHCATGIKLAIRADGETDEQVRACAGLENWPGQVIFISAVDAKL